MKTASKKIKERKKSNWAKIFEHNWWMIIGGKGMAVED